MCIFIFSDISMSVLCCQISVNVYFVLADINECASDGDNDCDQVCFNTYGSYGCRCNPGYELNEDEKTCQREYCIVLYYIPQK